MNKISKKVYVAIAVVAVVALVAAGIYWIVSSNSKKALERDFDAATVAAAEAFAANAQANQILAITDEGIAESLEGYGIILPEDYVTEVREREDEGNDALVAAISDFEYLELSPNSEAEGQVITSEALDAKAVGALIEGSTYTPGIGTESQSGQSGDSQSGGESINTASYLSDAEELGLIPSSTESSQSGSPQSGEMQSGEETYPVVVADSSVLISVPEVITREEIDRLAQITSEVEALTNETLFYSKVLTVEAYDTVHTSLVEKFEKADKKLIDTTALAEKTLAESKDKVADEATRTDLSKAIENAESINLRGTETLLEIEQATKAISKTEKSLADAEVKVVESVTKKVADDAKAELERIANSATSSGSNSGSSGSSSSSAYSSGSSGSGNNYSGNNYSGNNYSGNNYSGNSGSSSGGSSSPGSSSSGSSSSGNSGGGTWTCEGAGGTWYPGLGCVEGEVNQQTCTCSDGTSWTAPWNSSCAAYDPGSACKK